MKYLSVDIETGGIPAEMTVVECGLVADDLTKPFDERREMRIIVMPQDDAMLVSPWAAAQHQSIWNDMLHIADQPWWRDTVAGSYTNCIVRAGEPESIWDHDVAVVQQGYEYHAMQKVLGLLGFAEGETLNIAGKNPMGFDMPRLDLHGWLSPSQEEGLQLTGPRISYHRRCLDPAVFYFQPGDAVLPSLEECRQRAGIPPLPLHHALYDARMVCRLLRHRLTGE